MGLINRITGGGQDNTGRLIVPFENIDFYKIAQKEQNRFIKVAGRCRRKLRAQAFFFMLLLVSYLTYNAVSNLTTVQRNSQVQDMNTAADLQSNDPAYVAAKTSYEDNMALLNTLQAEYQNKIATYAASGEQSKRTHWLKKLEQVQKDKTTAQAEFSKVSGAVREQSNLAVVAFGSDLFHKLFGMAIPILMLLVGIGVVKLQEYERELKAALYLIMLPNAYFISSAVFHAFPYPMIDLPLLGKTSPAALFMLPVVFYVEPWATIVCLRMIMNYLDGWHDALQDIMAEREAHRSERAAILEDLLGVHKKVLKATSDANAHATGLKAEVVQQKAIEAAQAVKAEGEVKAAAEDAELIAMIPKAENGVELAKKIIEMESDGRMDAFKTRGGTEKMIIERNGMNPATVRAAKSNLRKDAEDPANV